VKSGGRFSALTSGRRSGARVYLALGRLSDGVWRTNACFVNSVHGKMVAAVYFEAP
jgi:hypothetical protein